MRRYDTIDDRVVEIAQYIADSGATVRQAASVFGVSKSTVHKDMTEKLRTINPALALRVSDVMMKNKAERHIRGGIATHNKYRPDDCLPLRKE